MDEDLWALLAGLSDVDLARLLDLLQGWDALRACVIATGMSGEWVDVEWTVGE